MRVLVVEDDASVATGVERCLRSEGFDVEVVDDGLVALDKLIESSFDVVVLDILLPGANGYRVCRTLRERGDWTPILMLTAKSGEYDEAEGLELGADDFLTKPYSTVVLLARIHSLLRRPRARDGCAAVGALRLDPLRGRCFRGAASVPLSPRELELLAYLVDRADEVVGKDELRNAIWGETYRGDPNTVEVYVGRLRRKLDAQFEARVIETVRGVGYRFSVDAVSSAASLS